MWVILMNKVIIFPTDTVYGIGTSIKNTEGIQRIYQIKHRDYKKPLACLCANLEQIEEIAEVDDFARNLILKYMPGALTIILKSKDWVFQTIGYSTIGVRIPKHSLAIQILQEYGPMLTTSVNESGETPLNEYDLIVKEYQNKVDFIYSSDEKSSNVSSTVVSCIDGDRKILRQGEIVIEKFDV